MATFNFVNGLVPAKVYGLAKEGRVFGKAEVYKDAQVFGKADITQTGRVFGSNDQSMEIVKFLEILKKAKMPSFTGMFERL